MSDIKILAQGLNPNAEARDIRKLVEPTGNIYEALAVIGRRARQLQTGVREELNDKLSEFVEVTDHIEEIVENKEQIEISKTYERLPNAAIIATEEYVRGELHAEMRFREEEESFH